MLPGQLSTTDAVVLAQVFGKEINHGKADVAFERNMLVDRHQISDQMLHELQAREQAAIAIVEAYEQSESSVNALQIAYDSALSVLDGVIEDRPDYASARNNRAQLRRWRYGDRHTICQSVHAHDRQKSDAGVAAIQDLKAAIALASPAHAHDGVRDADARLLAQAYTQLGAMCLAASKDLESASDMIVFDESYRAWTASDFEEEASRLFRRGGRYGSEVAQAMAVHTNPHAKLCGSIVQQAICKEIESAGCWR